MILLVPAVQHELAISIHILPLNPFFKFYLFLLEANLLTYIVVAFAIHSPESAMGT